LFRKADVLNGAAQSFTRPSSRASLLDLQGVSELLDDASHFVSTLLRNSARMFIFLEFDNEICCRLDQDINSGTSLLRQRFPLFPTKEFFLKKSLSLSRSREKEIEIRVLLLTPVE